MAGLARAIAQGFSRPAPVAVPTPAPTDADADGLPPPKAADFGLSAEEWAAYPARLSAARLRELLLGVTGESKSVLETRTLLRTELRTTSVPVPAEGRDYLSSLILSTTIGTLTPASNRRTIAGLIAAMQVFVDNPAARDLSIPSEAIRPGEPGRRPCVSALSEVLLHELEAAGRIAFEAFTRRLVDKFKKLAFFEYAFAMPGGTLTKCNFVTYVVKNYVAGYREYLTTRRSMWEPPDIVELLTRPCHQLPYNEGRPPRLDLMQFFAVYGLLRLVDLSHPEGDVIGDTLTVFEKGVDFFMETWRSTFVDTKKNRDLVASLSSQPLRSVPNPRSSHDPRASAPRSGFGGSGSRGGSSFGSGGGGGGAASGNGGSANARRDRSSTSRQPMRNSPSIPVMSGRKRAREDDGSFGPGAIGSGASWSAQGSAIGSGYPFGGVPGASWGPPGGVHASTGPSMPHARPSHPTPGGNGPPRQRFVKCMWRDRDGTPCTNTPPAETIARGGTTNPLCVKHRAAFDSLSGASRADFLAMMKRAGVDLE